MKMEENLKNSSRLNSCTEITMSKIERLLKFQEQVKKKVSDENLEFGDADQFMFLKGTSMDFIV